MFNITEKTSDILSIIFICLLTKIAWFASINTNSFWTDEIATITYSSGSFIDIFNYMVNGEFNPPLFYMLENVMISLFGVSELTLRFIPYIASILLIPVVYYLAKKLTNDRYVCWFSATIIAILPFIFYYSIEARCYTFALLLYTLGIYYYVTKNYTMAFILLGLLSWTHFYGIIFSIPIALHYLIGYKDRGFIKHIFIYIGINLPLLIPLYHLMALKQSADVGWGLNYLDILPQFFSEAGGMNILSGVILFVLFFIGMLLYKNKIIKLIYLLPLIITPILTIFINISTRYLIYFIPFYVIMLSYPLIKIDKKFMKACYCILILFLLFPGLQTVAQESKIDYRGAANYISENIDINTQIIVLPLTRENCFKHYYHKNNTILSFEPYDINGLGLTLSRKT